MKTKNRVIAMLLVLCTLLSVLPFSGLVAFAEAFKKEGGKDAMVDIRENFSSYQIGATKRLEDDGYIGIPVEMTVYFDSEHHTAVTGYNGTPVILYVVNTMIERIGTDSDTDIIRSMLDDGYIVYVLDYLNNEKAVSQDLDFSVQIIRTDIENGKHRTDTSVLPSGYYYDNFVVPAGYTVSIYNVFYEIDKHSAAGTLEKIVEIWNNDFKTAKGSALVKWVHENGERKTVAKASDGSEPIWYNASGKKDENGEYTNVKYTVAECITDCVDPDGSFIDLNQYMHIVYPTGGVKVPVMALANSSGRPTTSQTSADVRPHMNGFLFNGYATVVYDYMWTPMARSDSFGYFDGSQGNTGDHMNYAVQTYNNVELDTAAMRYIRYLALSQSETYNFDTDAIGVIGNSKGGWFTFLGEAILRQPLADASKYSTVDELEDAIDRTLASFEDNRIFPDHNGESRYQNGETEDSTVDGITIHGGERQPWLTYNGVEILSGANLIYASNGSNQKDVTEGYAPSFIAVHLYDDYNAAYGYSNIMVNQFRNMNIPAMWFNVPLGHMLTYGEDMDYGVDTYDAMFDFCGYYLKHDPIKVAYVAPVNKLAGVSVTSSITVKFTGAVSETEIKKVTVTDGNGKALSGSWSSEYGDTEWTFLPEIMSGSTVYTVTVPSDIAGDNGKAMGEAYKSSFITEGAGLTAAAVSGNYITVNVGGLEAGANTYELTFCVKNDAANIANIYAVNSTSDTDGVLVGSVNLSGSGYYSVDVTDSVADKVGNQVIFLIKLEKAAGEKVVYSEDFSSSIGSITKGRYTTLSLENGTLKAVIGNNKGTYTNSVSYNSASTVFSNNAISSTVLTEADQGRRFKVSFDVYDATSRYLTVQTTNSCTSQANGTIDYQRVIFNTPTVAGEWKTIEFEYVVYDSDYGASGSHKQGFTIISTSDGVNETPLYFDNIKVTEITTDVEISSAALICSDNGGVEYKLPSSDNAFTIMNGDVEIGQYSSFSAAVNAYKVGNTIVLQKNYTLTDSEISDKLSSFASVVIDLNGYKLSSRNTTGAFIWIKNTSASSTVVTVKNGEICLKDTSAVAYDGSTAASAGSSVYVDFENVRFTFADGASVTEVISSSSIGSGAQTKCTVTLDGCVIALDEAKHTYVNTVILPEGSGALTLSYKLIGGSFSLSSQRYLTIQAASKHTEFLKDANGDYTTLVMPSVKSPDEISYMRDDGYATYTDVDGAREDGYTVYVLYKSEYSTKYGIIPEKYADVQAYPLVVFDAEGNCVGASSFLAKDNGGGAFNYAAVQSEGEWIIYLRRDLSHTEQKFNNLSFVYGSVLFDLGGHTITVESGANRFLDAYAKRGNKTSVTLKNGTLSTGSIPFICFGSGTTAAYDGSDPKTFEFNFENITFKDVKATSLFKCENTAIPFNVELGFDDCVFELGNTPSGAVLFDLANAANKLSASVTVRGGTFKRDTFDGIKLYSTLNSSSSIIFTQNDSGEYATVQTAVDGAPISDNIPTAVGNMAYENGVVENGVKTYTLYVNPLATAYGVIPSEYADAEKYPFAVFMNGEFVSADTSWALAVSRAKDKLYGSSGAGKEVQILMRRAYTSVSSDGTSGLWNYIGGSVVIDLNGFTFTRADQYFIDIVFKDTVSKSNSSVIEYHDINISVKNGSIVSKKQIVALNRNSAYTGKKSLYMTFDNVNIIPSKDAANDNANIVCWNDGGTTPSVNAYITYNNCVFDLSNARSSAKLFVVNDGSNLINVDIQLKGGNIIAQTITNSTLFVIGSGDKYTFVKDKDGNYTTLTMPSTASAPTAEYNTTEGAMKFARSAVSGSDHVYSLVKLKTEYGTIPDAYASVIDYPFVYFDKDGNFKGASSTFYGANAGSSIIGKAKDYLSANVFDTETKKYTGTVLEAYILMRRDYALGSGEYFNNLSQIQDTVTIDLGGYTITSEYISLFPSGIKGWGGSGDAKVFPTTIVVKNGDIVTKDKSVVAFDVWNSVGGNDSTAMLDKLFMHIFENVRFSLASGSAATAPLISYSKNNSTPNAVGNAAVSFTDCEFDFKSVASSKNITLFNATPTASNCKLNVSVTVNGGSVLLTDISKVSFGSSGNGSSLTYGKGSDDKYITVALPSNSKAPSSSETFNTTEGLMTLSKSGEANGTVFYTLGKPIVTEYGEIPAVYGDVQAYPFAVFYNGKFIGAYATWAEAGKSAVAQVTGVSHAGDTVYVLLRRDFQNTGDTFWTLSNVGGTFVLDLGGHTFTRDAVFIDLSASATNGVVHETNIVIKNGTALAYKNSIVASQYQDLSAYKNEKVFNITFENVKFGFASGATTTNLLWIVWDNNRNVNGGKVNAVFNGCTFDLTTNAPSGKTVTVFDVADRFDSVAVNAVINGGKLIASDWNSVKLIKANDGHDSLFFGKYGDAYTVLELGKGTAPTDAFVTVSDGKAFFKALESGEGYVLVPCTHKYDNDCDSTCNICGAVRPVGDHSYVNVGSDETEHWKECACGVVDESSREAHSFDNGKINSDGSITYTCEGCHYTVTSDELCKLGMEFDGEHYTYLGKTSEWVRFDGGFCYFDKAGHLMINTESGNRIFGKYGYLIDGSVKYEGYTYLFIDGVMQTDRVANVGAYCYRFDELGRGTRMTDVYGLTETSNNGSVYVKPDGKLLRNGWIEIDGDWYFFGKDYKMAVGTVVISGVSFEFGADGKCETEFGKLALREDGSTVYITDNGTLLRSGWVEIDGKYYYFNRDNVMVKGCEFETVDGWFTFGENGETTIRPE